MLIYRHVMFNVQIKYVDYIPDTYQYISITYCIDMFGTYHNGVISYLISYIIIFKILYYKKIILYNKHMIFI